MRHTPAYQYQYRFIITEPFYGMSLIDFYTRRFTFKTREYWLHLINTQLVSVNSLPVSPDYILQKNDVLRTIRPDVQEPDVNDELDIIYNQNGIFVLNKRAPIAVHPCGRYFKNSLTSILKENFPDQTFHTIHRLDVWTTGVLIFATSAEQAQELHAQIDKKQMLKFYAVLAKGDFPDVFSINEPIGRAENGHRGVGENIRDAKDCLTEFQTLSRKNGVSLLKANPITGRTNQIRVHVLAAGGEVLNDPIYTKSFDGKVNDNPPFLGLHCREMTCKNADKQPLTFKADWPEHFTHYFDKKELDALF